MTCQKGEERRSGTSQELFHRYIELLTMGIEGWDWSKLKCYEREELEIVEV
jgi:hypothetical protein